jgi:hypothetical protein
MVDNYYEAEKSNNKRLKQLKNEVVQGVKKEIEASVGVSIP